MIEKHGIFSIVRDDLVFGGTKRIALETWLPSLDTDHVVYSGSVFGWGAPALVAACETLGIECTILMSKSDYVPPWLDRAAHKLVMTDPLPVEELNRRASEYNGLLLPSGFDHPGFIAAIAHRASMMEAPRRAWVPVVSGTLLRALEQAWPKTKLLGVAAAKNHGYTGKMTIYQSPEKFTKPALNPPPYPSCPFSDAKVWQFAAELGKQDDLIWNTNP